MKSALETDVLSPRECASVLKALADETRLRILESLLAEEKCVSDLVRELGCTQPHVSHHLRILRDSGVETVEFRASLVIGTGSLSFDLVKSLTDRLPVMLCPSWLTTPTQPVAVDDVLAYLLAARVLPPGESQIFEIGCEDVTTYGGMIREYARQRGVRRWLIFVPILTPYLSSLWLALVTPTAFEVGRHLIEGLKNPTVVRDTRALQVFPIRPMTIREAIEKAIAKNTK